jgi:hypothetical protein
MTAFTTVAKRIRYDIDPKLAAPDSLIDNDLPFLQGTELVPVGHPRIAELTDQIAPTGMSALAQLQAIHHYCTRIKPTEPSDPDDALTVLREGAGGSAGKSRLFAAMARHRGYPTRLVTGLRLEPEHDAKLLTWVEVRLGWVWVPFCPTGDLFATTDGKQIPFYRGDYPILSATPGTDVDVHFSVEKTFAVQGRLVNAVEKSFASCLGFWGALERCGLPVDILRLIIMFPLGALASVVLRNVIGLKTFGFFLPTLLAVAATKTGFAWGMLALLGVVALIALVRQALSRFRLLHFPLMAILITASVLSALLIALVGARFGLDNLTHITLFPFAVMTLTAENCSAILEEEGHLELLKVLGLSMVSIAVSFIVMSNASLQIAMLTFPELALIVIFVDVLLGRWVGIRVLEYWRFRGLRRSEEVLSHA